MKLPRFHLPKITKTQWLIIALSGVVVLGTVMLLNRRTQPASVPPPQITGGVPQKAVRTITYSGEPLTLPEQMPVYRNSADELKLLDLVRRIATERNLPPSPNSQTLWVSAETGEYVHLDPNTNVVTYGRDLPPTDAPLPDPARAQKVAEGWIKDTLGQTVEADEKNLKYFAASGSQLVPVSPGNAEILEIPLNLTLNDYPVVVGNAAIPVATISVGRNHTITRAILKPFALTPTLVAQLETIDFATIIANLKDQGEIISIMPREPVDTIAHPPTEITLSEAQIQYRLDQKTQLVYPYVVFNGTTKLERESATAEVVVITPAITPNF